MANTVFMSRRSVHLKRQRVKSEDFRSSHHSLEQFVVRDSGFKFEQVLFVLRIVFGNLNIGTCKSDNCFPRLSKGKRDEVRYVILHPAKNPRPFVAPRRSVGGDAGLEEVFEICCCIACLGLPMPDSSYHFILLA